MMLSKLSTLSIIALLSMTLNQGVAKALTGSVRSTGWRQVSSQRERSCARKGIEKMKILVFEGWGGDMRAKK
ncbi:hypothetical protein BJP34_27825 [Moorena producens PAL-8-15-08-1]|uniref:Secreted protein n=1 Tax=Moorena producens PAL-8-15-08-1 TaxID=1458985 RepID=A0A1D8TYX5_9CYAN|nr:hypothetical protein BJP34_27825 [Moorena producens PAL-8-15-08-1]